MDISEIRQRNLQLLERQLRARLGKKGKPAPQKDAAIALDMSPSFLSQLIGGKKLGDDVARKIERAQRLPKGWMDVLQQPGSASQSADVVHLPTSQSAGPSLDNMVLAVETTRYWIEFHGLVGSVEDHIPLLAIAHDLVLEVRAAGAPGTVLDLSKKLAARLREESQHADERAAGAGSGGKNGGVRGKPARGRRA